MLSDITQNVLDLSPVNSTPEGLNAPQDTFPLSTSSTHLGFCHFDTAFGGSNCPCCNQLQPLTIANLSALARRSSAKLVSIPRQSHSGGQYSQLLWLYQYEGLEKVYAKYKDQGFVVLGFPSNDFGQQEPGSNKEIADFCKNTYDVKFPMFAKSSVSGNNPNPLFKMLIAKTGTTPKWNFYKYLIDRNGNVVDSYGSMTKPTSSSITGEIEKLLGEKPQ
jgi:glutathione peroxidase-family protein